MSVSPNLPAADTDLLQVIADLQAKIALNERIIDELKASADAACRAKNELFANKSHELRTPLNTIIGYSEMLQEEHCDSGEKCLLPDLRKIHTAGRQLLALIDDVLDISRVEAGQPAKEIAAPAEAPDASGETLETVEHTLTAISKTAVKPVLTRLAAYLAEDDGKAADYFEAQRDYFESALTADYFTRLDKLLYDFKFHEALSLLEISVSESAAPFELNEKHTILIVDDIQENLVQMSTLLKGRYKTKTALNAADALRIAASDPMPDLILLDIIMPGTDGYEVCRRLKADETTCDIPVIFLTAKNEIEDERRGFELGAVDYLTKPVSLPIALARLKTHIQIKAARDHLKEKARRQTEENHLVAHLMEQMMHSPGLRDDHVRYWITPSELVSGDLVAAARNNHDQLFVMLADSTGHGLPAALNLLPVNRIFYRMVEKGFPVQAIVDEMNRTIIRQSPPDRFVAAVVASIDTANRVIELWNGGIPAALFCDRAGAVQRLFPPTSFPLGIVVDGFPACTQIYQWEGDGQLIVFSDGLLEAEDAQGIPFGFERTAAALQVAPDEECFDSLVGHLHRHLGDRNAHDDVSLLVARCLPAAEAQGIPHAIR
ncbi:MAG: SpoIIE family protein phosphatase [Sulfuricellaceae bacterium]